MRDAEGGGDPDVWVAPNQTLEAADGIRVATGAAFSSMPGPLPVVDADKGGPGAEALGLLVTECNSFMDNLAIQGELLSNGVILGVWDAIRADDFGVPADPVAPAPPPSGASFE